jgi:hypothetical protein
MFTEGSPPVTRRLTVWPPLARLIWGRLTRRQLYHPPVLGRLTGLPTFCPSTWTCTASPLVPVE